MEIGTVDCVIDLFIMVMEWLIAWGIPKRIYNWIGKKL